MDKVFAIFSTNNLDLWNLESFQWFLQSNNPIITKQFGFSPSPHHAYDLSHSYFQENKSWVHHHSAGKLMRWQDPGKVIHGLADREPGWTKYIGGHKLHTHICMNLVCCIFCFICSANHVAIHFRKFVHLDSYAKLLKYSVCMFLLWIFC